MARTATSARIDRGEVFNAPTIISSTITRAATVSAFLSSRPLQTRRPRGLFTDAEYEGMRLFFSARPDLRSTPVHDLSGLAARTGLGRLSVKDETGRFGLNAFKLLGARFAIERMIAAGQLRPGETVVCASE